MEKRIIWKEASKVERYAYNHDEEYLGNLILERVGAHMHWCWYQSTGIRMSPGCLQEVRDKQKELCRLNRRYDKNGNKKN